MPITKLLASASIGALLLLGTQSFAVDKDEEAREKAVKMSQVPKPARDAAQKELGMKPTEARIVSGTNPQEYELEAKAKSGKEVGVHVLADGTVTKHESEHADKD